MITFPNDGIPIITAGSSIPLSSLTGSTNFSAIAAAGRSFTVIGKLALEGGSGTKTISNAGIGGRIYIGKLASRTFSNVGSTLRVGIQDVGVTGLEDGTFDVYTDLTGGDYLPTNSVLEFIMSQGSKTISHGDPIAISVEFISRAGTDTLTFSGNTSDSNTYPYVTIDFAGVSTKLTTASMPSISIVFDDGTVGWISGAPVGLKQGSTSLDISGGGGNEEHGFAFTLPFSCAVSRFVLSVVTVNSITTTFSFDIYSDPLGTPSLVASKTVTVAELNGAMGAGIANVNLDTPVSLSANTLYGLVVRNRDVTNAYLVNNIEFGHTPAKKGTILGTDWYPITRTGASGAFADVGTNALPWLGFYANNIEVAGGGSGGNYTFG
jgi:hypothetical protein